MMSQQIPQFLHWFHQKAAYLPHIMALISAMVSVALVLFGRFDLFLRAGSILIPLIIISIILIINKKNLSCNDAAFNLSLSQKSLTKLYLLITVGLFIWTICGHFDMLQLILLGGSYLIILLQIFSKNVSTKVLLLEITVTTVLLTIPQLFHLGYFYGDTDITTHSNYVNLIADIGTLNDVSLDAYQSFCLSHISGAICSLFSGLTDINSYSLVCSIIEICAIPFVYLLAKYFVKSEHLAILSAFIYSILPIVLSSITSDPTPRKLATVTFFIILYVLFSLSKRNPAASILITTILTLFLSGVHHAQIFLLFIILAFLVLGCLLYYKKVTLGHIVPFVLLLIIPISWQIYHYLTNLVSGIFKGRLLAMYDSGAISDTVLSTTTTDTMAEFTFQTTLNLIPPALFTVFIFAALIVLLTKVQHPKKISILLPLLLFLFVVFVPMVLDSVPAIVQAFQLSRIRFNLTAFFAIAMAVGCAVLLNIPKTKRGIIISKTIVLGLCGMLIFSSAIVSGTKTTNEVFQNPDWTSTSLHFTDSDVAMFNLLLAYGPDNSKVSSDFDYTSYLNRQLNAPDIGYRKPYSVANGLLPAFSEQTDLSDMQYIIFPENKFRTLTLRITEGKSKYTGSKFKYIPYSDDAYNMFMSNMYSFNTFYDNKDDKVFVH